MCPLTSFLSVSSLSPFVCWFGGKLFINILYPFYVIENDITACAVAKEC